MKKNNLVKGLMGAIVIFCLSLFILANQTRIRGGVCASSSCSGLNESSLATDYIKDYYIAEKTNLLIAPTGLLIPKMLAHLDDLEVKSYYTKSKFSQHIHFDKKDEEFNIGKDNFPYVSKLRAKESHLFISFILIKLVILLNLIWWIPLGWVFYKIIKRYKKNPNTVFIFFFKVTIIFRSFLAIINNLS